MRTDEVVALINTESSMRKIVQLWDGTMLMETWVPGDSLYDTMRALAARFEDLADQEEK